MEPWSEYEIEKARKMVDSGEYTQDDFNTAMECRDYQSIEMAMKAAQSGAPARHRREELRRRDPEEMRSDQFGWNCFK